MADLYVSYFGDVSKGVATGPKGSQVVTTSTSSASGTTPEGSKVAALFSDTAHYVTTGDSPTATIGNGFYLPASTLYWVDLEQGLGDTIAAITLA
jgi:hypothetical protein